MMQRSWPVKCGFHGEILLRERCSPSVPSRDGVFMICKPRYADGRPILMTSLYPKACGQHVVEGRKVWTSYAKFEQRVTFFLSFFFLFREKRRAASDVLQDTMPLRVPRDTARLRPANAGRVCQLNIDDVAVFLTQPGAARYGGRRGGCRSVVAATEPHRRPLCTVFVRAAW